VEGVEEMNRPRRIVVERKVWDVFQVVSQNFAKDQLSTKRSTVLVGQTNELRAGPSGDWTC